MIALPAIRERRVAVGGEFLLVPVGVWKGESADFVEAFDLGWGEAPSGGGEVIAELLVGAGADDDGIDAGLTSHPI